MTIERLRRVIVEVMAAILVHALAEVTLVVVPLLLAVGATQVLKAHLSPVGTIIIMVLAICWALTTLSFVLLRRSLLERSKERTLDIVNAMSSTDWALAQEATITLSDPSRRQALKHTVIKDLIGQMCAILAPNVNGRRKGATLLILNTPTGQGQRFEIFAEVHHNEPALQAEIQRLTGPDHLGLAGYALRRGSCVVLRDSSHPPQNVGWTWETLNASESYHGHAATSIKVNEGPTTRAIGVLCFDVMEPWTLSTEDRELMQVFADKIAVLWVLMS